MSDVISAIMIGIFAGIWFFYVFVYMDYLDMCKKKKEKPISFFAFIYMFFFILKNIDKLNKYKEVKK
jgi:hypothetical protein